MPEDVIDAVVEQSVVEASPEKPTLAELDEVSDDVFFRFHKGEDVKPEEWKKPVAEPVKTEEVTEPKESKGPVIEKKQTEKADSAYAKLRRENRELAEKLQQLSTQAAPDVTTRSAPAELKEPTLEDAYASIGTLDDAKSLEEYVAAAAKVHAKHLVAYEKQQDAKVMAGKAEADKIASEQAEIEKSSNELAASWKTNCDAAVKTKPALAEVFAKPLPDSIDGNQPLLLALAMDPNGPHVLAYLMGNSEQAEKLARMEPVRLVREVTLISERLRTEQPKPISSKLPNPPKIVGGVAPQEDNSITDELTDGEAIARMVRMKRKVA